MEQTIILVLSLYLILQIFISINLYPEIVEKLKYYRAKRKKVFLEDQTLSTKEKIEIFFVVFIVSCVDTPIFFVYFVVTLFFICIDKIMWAIGEFTDGTREMLLFMDKVFRTCIHKYLKFRKNKLSEQSNIKFKV